MRASILAVAFLLGGQELARADTPPRGAIEGVVTDEATGRPVAGATAILTPASPSPTAMVSTSNAGGRFGFRALPAGSYTLLLLFGEARKTVPTVSVAADGTILVRATLPVGAEVISIHERAPLPATRPKVVPGTSRPILPYTDEAISSNSWAVGWMLLDVSEAGRVTAFRFLHRPERGLDKLAEQEVWRLRFEPAVDATGKPVPSQVLWKMEWPAYWWYRAAIMKPSPDFLTPEPDQRGSIFVSGGGAGFLLPRGKAGVRLPPCRGTAPLNLDIGNEVGARGFMPVFNAPGVSEGSGAGIGEHGVYRDCSPPDRERAKDEPLIRRPTP